MSLPERNYLDENVYISVAATQYDSIGVYHNIILRDIYNDDPDNFFKQQTTGEALSIVNQNVNKYFSNNRRIEFKDIIRFNNFYDKLTTYVLNSDEEGLLAFYKDVDTHKIRYSFSL